MTGQQQNLSNADEWDDNDLAWVVNPATGLPMVDNHIGSIDVGGSPYGQDSWAVPVSNSGLEY